MQKKLNIKSNLNAINIQSNAPLDVKASSIKSNLNAINTQMLC